LPLVRVEKGHILLIGIRAFVFPVDGVPNRGRITKPYTSEVRRPMVGGCEANSLYCFFLNCRSSK
jgi:hypothetical protein